MKIALNASTLLTPKAGIGLYTDKIARALFFSPDYDVHFFFKRYWSKNIFKQNNKNFLFDKFINKLTPKTLRFQKSPLISLRPSSVTASHNSLIPMSTAGIMSLKRSTCLFFAMVFT